MAAAAEYHSAMQREESLVSIESVAEIQEGRLLRLLAQDPMLQNWILPPDGTDGSRRLFETQLADLTARDPAVRGDVDLLVVRPGHADEASAVQFKCVKVDSDTFQTGLPNRVGEISKLARQANLLVTVGFHRVSASVLVLVDSRGIPGFNPWFGSAPISVIQAVDSAVATAGFHPAVWVESIEICQPFNEDFRHKGTTSGRRLRHGSVQLQSADVTTNVRRLVEGAA